MGRATESRQTRLFRRMSRFCFLVQQVDTGALPALYAATSPDAKGGAFYGPDGLAHLTGGAAEQEIYRPACSTEDAARLWTVSEQIAPISFPAA